METHSNDVTTPAQETIRLSLPSEEGPGTRLGRYKLLEKVGEGGCGVVYVAEQTEPVRRRVALKVIKLGMDTKQVIARFEAERQALAMMDHPNIAKVLDAGTTETGRPHFVMELVRGIRITDYCDQERISTKERIALFIKVCQAIQHAHQKGIIHRDIKPSNILVTLHDGVPVPKVIDFGIAKATESRLTDATVYTQLHQFIGTPAYMSPEQAEMSGLDIDTRSDIYSLGVLLYELLTGKTPFDPNELLSQSLDAIRKTIREKEPVRPSTKVATLNREEMTTTARRRSSDAPKLIHLLKGDLDWIVMKCLEKDRTRRYETANDLAADLKRHLNNEPVLARPPSAAYRFEKLVRRNKFASAAIAAVLLVLVFGLVTTSWQASRARKAERTQADLARQAERAKEREAQQRSISEQRLYDFLLSLATSKRQEGQVGYRSVVFQYLQQAASLDVRQKDPDALRAVAISCLGDVAGLPPISITNFPPKTEIRWFSIDSSGRIGAFTLSDGSILLRKLPSGEDIERLHLHAGEPAERCEVSQDGQQLVSLHLMPDRSRTSVRLWARGHDAHWGEPERIAAPNAVNVKMLNGNPFVCSYDEEAHLYKVVDLKTRKVVIQLEHSQRPDWIASAGSQVFLIVTRDAVGPKSFTIHAWNVTTGQELKSLQPELDYFLGLYPSQDGRYLACLADTGVEIYRLDRLEPIAKLPLPGRAFGWRSASLARNATVLAFSDDHHRIRLWDWTSNRDAVASFDDNGMGPEDNLEFLADDRYLLAVGNRQAKLYPFSWPTERTVVPSRKAGLNLVGFSPDSQRFGAVCGDGQLVEGDVWTGRNLWETNATEGAASGRFKITSVSFGRDGLMAIGWCLDPQGPQKGGLVFWHERRRLALLNTPTNQPLFIFSPEFTPDGRFLAAAVGEDSAMNNSRFHVWRVERHSTERVVDSLKLHHMMTLGEDYSVMAVDNGRIAYASSRATNAASEIHLVELEGPQTDRVLAHGAPLGFQWLGFTPDRRQLLAVNTNYEIVALDLVTGDEVTPPIRDRNGLKAKDRKAVNFSLSPDGSKLALDAGAGVEIWDWKARRYLYSLPEPEGRILFVRWSPDAQHLAVCSWSETSIWHLPLVERVLADLGLSP